MNRLSSESSLYLRQHANNPVDWHAWNQEAIGAAKQNNKPIFLSIGYSACHWCHVMEHESFEDAGTATVMNEHFINIKVDREERPDLDQIYMTAHGLLNRGEGGGWPLSVWLTPDLTPFYAGTYFPPIEKYGRPSFKRVLLSIADAWQKQRDKLTEIGGAVKEHLNSMAAQESASDAPLTREPLVKASAVLNKMFDPEYGGFGRAPKFPHSLDLQLLLRTDGDQKIVTQTLTAMARGGLYDQVGGGFHRYSVDQKWLVPHFEKMLYDNAQLPPVYVDAYLATGEEFFLQIACETLDYVLKEMTSPEGGFYSTQDADSEGHEGKFFVWSEAELDLVLGPLSQFAKNVWSTSKQGNFEGKNILHRWRSDADDAVGMGMTLEEFRAVLKNVNEVLYKHRATRIWPGRDEKILTSWNGLMIHAMAYAGMNFNEPKYVEAARSTATFLFNKLCRDDGRLYRTCGVNEAAKYDGYLDDYAFLIQGLVTLAEATGDVMWIRKAEQLTDQMIAHFSAPNGGFYYTADDHETLIARTRDLQDGSLPSGNGTAALALLRLNRWLGRNDFQDVAERTIRAHRDHMDENPMASAQMILALDLLLNPDREVILVADREDSLAADVVKSLRRSFRPKQLVVLIDSDSDMCVSLFQDRKMIDHQPTMYLCKNRVCQAPIVGWDAIRASI